MNFWKCPISTVSMDRETIRPVILLSYSALQLLTSFSYLSLDWLINTLYPAFLAVSSIPLIKELIKGLFILEISTPMVLLLLFLRPAAKLLGRYPISCAASLISLIVFLLMLLWLFKALEIVDGE